MGERQGSVCAREFATEKDPAVRETLVDEGQGEKDSGEPDNQDFNSWWLKFERFYWRFQRKPKCKKFFKK